MTERTLQRSERRNPVLHFFEWLTENYERAQMHDHDRYVAAARNPREVSQRLHEIEQGPRAFYV